MKRVWRYIGGVFSVEAVLSRRQEASVAVSCSCTHRCDVSATVCPGEERARADRMRAVPSSLLSCVGVSLPPGFSIERTKRTTVPLFQPLQTCTHVFGDKVLGIIVVYFEVIVFGSKRVKNHGIYFVDNDCLDGIIDRAPHA